MKILQTFLLVGLTALSLACGYGSHSTMPPQPGVVPTVTQLAPDNVNSGSGGFMLTVNGTNFSMASQVNWNGVAQTTTFVSANQLMASIPASAVASPSAAMVTVTNPGTAATGAYGSGATMAEMSNSMTFTIN